ncbi:MAG: hypothetical protein R3B13_12150 [Polyangiaceae bacterium]
MKFRSILPAALFLSATLGACMMPPQNGAAQTGPLVSDEQKNAVRDAEARADEMEAKNDVLGQQVGEHEQKLVKALNQALGKEASSPGMPMPTPSATAIKDLRGAKIKLSLVPVEDQNGKAVADNFLQLKDSFTDKMKARPAGKKMTPAELKEVQAATPHVQKLNDLRMQLMNLSMVTMQANSMLQTNALTTLMRVSGMVRTRKQQEMEFTEADYKRVQRWLNLQRRVENVAGLSFGLLASYQAVLNAEGEPAVLDALASKALENFPKEPDVTLDEAKAYVKNMKGTVGQVKSQYEAMMRKIHGDARYEAQYKSGIDAVFSQAAGAESQKSVTQMANESNQKYEADRAKCYRGESIDPGSLVSPPTCKQLKELGESGKPLPAAGAAAEEAMAEAEDSAFDLFGSLPGFNLVKASVEGLSALARGDTEGALKAAVGLIPGGSALRGAIDQVSKTAKLAKR